MRRPTRSERLIGASVLCLAVVLAVLLLAWASITSALDSSRADVQTLRRQVIGLGATPAVSAPPGVRGIPGLSVVGPAGRDGLSIVGPRGELGPVGKPGLHGIPGMAGAMGVAGGQGAAGPIGSPGPAGADGNPGPDGSQGPSGPPGPAPSDFWCTPNAPPNPDGAQHCTTTSPTPSPAPTP